MTDEIRGPDGKLYVSKTLAQMGQWEMARCLAAATIPNPLGESYNQGELRLQRAQMFAVYIVMPEEKLREVMRALFVKDRIAEGGSILVPV